ncbi:MAG: hypothetical protein ACRDUA_14445 [Micromonosporaceae bacterium]
MRLHVDAWDPSYGASYENASGDSPRSATTAPVDPNVERPENAWQPLLPGPEVRPPGTVLLVDGVRRIDARVWVTDDDGDSHQGICASYAAGVVRCDLERGAAELADALVAHGVFAPGPALSPIAAHPRAVYRPHRVTGAELAEPELQRQLHQLEVEVSGAARDTADDLLVVDGPLRGRTSLPGTLGYAKTHHKQYLEPALARVVAALRPGQRTPLFLLGAPWNRYSWYLRLPGPDAAPWAGVVRLECTADQPLPAAVRHADVAAVTLPRFASTPYKDPRAPQNLVPIAGLERRLRTLLGDVRLLQRGLRTAAARTGAA